MRRIGIPAAVRKPQTPYLLQDLVHPDADRYSPLEKALYNIAHLSHSGSKHLHSVATLQADGSVVVSETSIGYIRMAAFSLEANVWFWNAREKEHWPELWARQSDPRIDASSKKADLLNLLDAVSDCPHHVDQNFTMKLVQHYPSLVKPHQQMCYLH